MDNLETEVKFFLTDPQAVRQRIMKIGARSWGRVFESNMRYDDAGQSLRKKKSLLRVRRDKTVKLTFKSPPHEDNPQYKIFKELEVEVSDFDTMHRILEALGFHQYQVYEKWRETLVMDRTRFCLDSMPYGEFLEIEGTQQAIRSFANQLGLQWGHRILLNYLQIFEMVRDKLNLDFSDVTFDNFDHIDVNLSAYIDLLIAGD